MMSSTLSPREREFLLKNSSTISSWLLMYAPTEYKKINEDGSGELIFSVDNLSYTPTDIINNTHIKRHLWGIDPHQPLEESVLYRNLTDFSGILRTPYFLDHCDARGTFTLFRDNLGHEFGTLKLDSLSHPPFKDALPAVSPYALTMKAHGIRKIGNFVDKRKVSASFYTEDPDGSEWSIHCKQFKMNGTIFPLNQ